MTIPFRIDDHPLWPVLITYICFITGRTPNRGRGGMGRIEVREPRDAKVKAALLGIEQRCVACHRVINPVRQRAKTEAQYQSSMFYSPSCEQHVKAGCSRGTPAHNETRRLIRLIDGYVDPHQPSFFEEDEATT